MTTSELEDVLRVLYANRITCTCCDSAEAWRTIVTGICHELGEAMLPGSILVTHASAEHQPIAWPWPSSIAATATNVARLLGYAPDSLTDDDIRVSDRTAPVDRPSWTARLPSRDE